MSQLASQTKQENKIKAASESGMLRRTAISPTITPVHSSILQRCSNGVECAGCRAKRLERESLQRTGVNADPVNAVPPIVHDVLNSPGQSLDAGTRAFMEPRFGHDFSRVRVHTDARAAESARSVNALAYTVGRNVVFGTGQYAPGTSEGRRLMAHELTHVVQQASSANRVQSKLSVGDARSASEYEADQVAEAVVGRRPIPTDTHITGLLAPTLQRVEGPCPDVSEPHKLLIRKSISPAVREAQHKLNLFHTQEVAVGRNGLQDAPLAEDCIFGDHTFNAVYSFQQQRFPGKPAEYDGKIGDHTWTELDKITETPIPPSPTPKQERKVPSLFDISTLRPGKVKPDGQIEAPGLKVTPTIFQSLTPANAPGKEVDSDYHLVVTVGPLTSLSGPPLLHGFCQDSSVVIGGKYDWKGIPIGKRITLLGEPELDVNAIPLTCGKAPGTTLQINALKLSIAKDIFDLSLQGVFGLQDNWIKTWGLTGGGGAELDYKFGCAKVRNIRISSTLFGSLMWTWTQGTAGQPDTAAVTGQIGLKFELPDDCK